ncbi:MAG: SCP2 sterol-binding domain-containing protein [Porticoccaceae bacterium]
MTGAVEAFALARLEALIDGALKLDPGSRAALQSLAGRSLAIHCTFPARSLLVSFDSRGSIHLSQDMSKGTDVALTGSAVSLAVLMANASRQVSFANSGVTIAGDQDVLRKLSAILENLDIDWESALAGLIGDTPAHLLASAVRRALKWQKSASARATSGVGEFLREESGLTLGRSEIEPWSQAVRLLAFDSDRLAARIARLRARMEAAQH